MAAVTAAAITGAAVLGSAKMQSDASKKAARAQGAAGDAAIAEQQAARDQFQQNISPYLQSGQTGLAGLNALNSGDYSGFESSPDYLWAQQQGMQGLERSAAARGSLFNGGTDADRMAFNQGLASQQLGTYRNSLFNMAQMGQNAAVGAGGMGQQSANAIGNIFAGQAQAQANNSINQSNAWGNALQGLAGVAGQYAGQRQSSYQQPQTAFSSNVLGANTVQVGNQTRGW